MEKSKLQSMHSFLDNNSGDWRECLNTSLRFLRESWASQWVGLPFVVDACANFLNLNATTLTDDGTNLLAVAREVASLIEADSSRSPSSEEPHYHNRLHFADVLTTVTLQAAIESGRSNLGDKQWQAALILIALVHDFQHPGRVNHHLAEIEQLSVDALRPHLKTHALPDLWIKRIEHVILSSDFALVSKNHARVAGKSFAWNVDWAIVLINEADVMASVSEAFGSELGFALASEWATASLPMHSSVATDQGRLVFLASTFFSSYSAAVLGAPIERLKQLGGHRK
uniref:hypothetical protein n=1 Tax=Orrella sp. TaxID=1921583 RepID=UPI0040472968